MVALAALELFAFLVAMVFYVVNERAARTAWSVETVPVPRVATSYRTNEAYAIRVRDRAPLSIRLVALSGYLFGHAVVLGGLAVLGGLVAYGIGAAGLPGMWVAWYQFVVADDLLHRRPVAPPKARLLARVATILNLVVLLILGIMVVLTLAYGDWETIAYYAPVAVYAVLSLAQASALKGAASRLERDFEDEFEVPLSANSVGASANAVGASATLL